MSEAIDYAARVPVYEINQNGEAVEVSVIRFASAIEVAVENWNDEQRARHLIAFPGQEQKLLTWPDAYRIYHRPDFPRR